MHPESTGSLAPNILQIRNVEVVYDEAILGVHDISLEVAKGEIVALLGANGAGKSTTMKAISGMLLTERARVQSGDILLNGKSIVGIQPHHLTRQKIVHVLEGRRVFAHLTVEENLRAGAFVAKPSRAEMDAAIEEVYGWFPRLKQKRKTPAGLTSGGEQQMLAIGRALLTKPELMLLDEPSMGLAPILTAEIFEIITSLNQKHGVSFLVAEQSIHFALRHSHRAYLIGVGRVVTSGRSAELLRRDDLHELYLQGSTK
ncbi:MAG TPA: ABC transporter ATP-binding protein [Dongiaceae bacterium]|nr:ABC transporter ATP-binding protein [Dongiaceae bacterium]